MLDLSLEQEPELVFVQAHRQRAEFTSQTAVCGEVIMASGGESRASYVKPGRPEAGHGLKLGEVRCHKTVLLQVQHVRHESVGVLTGDGLREHEAFRRAALKRDEDSLAECFANFHFIIPITFGV